MTGSNRLFSYLYWENNLHAEHHLVPGGPYHRQHRVRDVLGDRVVNHSRSYVRWHWALFRGLRHPTGEAVIDLRDQAIAHPTTSVADEPGGARPRGRRR